jgi:hypothetical protein
MSVVFHEVCRSYFLYWSGSYGYCTEAGGKYRVRVVSPSGQLRTAEAADPDNDSTVDAKELKSAAHHPLVRIRRPSLLKFVGREERYTKRQKRWHRRGE